MIISSQFSGAGGSGGGISEVLAGPGVSGGGANSQVSLAIDYIGNDSVIKSATDGTGITIDTGKLL